MGERKRTKQEALERLAEARSKTGRVPIKNRRAKAVHDLAYAGAMGLIMLDPLNRLADQRIVLPLDMVCIPAYQAYMIEGTPSMQIYVRAGETIIPTGGNVEDVQEALDEASAESIGESLYPHGVHTSLGGGPRKTSAYQKAYKKAFKEVAPKHKKQNGTWKKGGFKKAVKEAHAKARK